MYPFVLIIVRFREDFESQYSVYALESDCLDTASSLLKSGAVYVSVWPHDSERGKACWRFRRCSECQNGLGGTCSVCGRDKVFNDRTYYSKESKGT